MSYMVRLDEFVLIEGEWSANKKCALSSVLFRRVEVPLALK
jgi:hypothetical protein